MRSVLRSKAKTSSDTEELESELHEILKTNYAALEKENRKLAKVVTNLVNLKVVMADVELDRTNIVHKSQRATC